MAEITFASFADIVANRKASSAVSGNLDVKFKTGAVKCLKLIDGPEGCTGVHCTSEAKHCKHKECISRLQKKVATLRSENKKCVVEIDNCLAMIDGLLVEISVHCRTDSLYYPTMEESRLALELALTMSVAKALCECVACELDFQQREGKLLKQKVKAVETRYEKLSEYRRAHDTQALARTNEGYMKGGNRFTPVGSAKAKGVQALRPTLQLQNSYDVQRLTMNSMEERPLIVSGKKKNRKKRS